MRERPEPLPSKHQPAALSVPLLRRPDEVVEFLLYEEEAAADRGVVPGAADACGDTGEPRLGEAEGEGVKAERVLVRSCPLERIVRRPGNFAATHQASLRQARKPLKVHHPLGHTHRIVLRNAQHALLTISTCCEYYGATKLRSARLVPVRIVGTNFMPGRRPGLSRVSQGTRRCWIRQTPTGPAHLAEPTCALSPRRVGPRCGRYLPATPPNLWSLPMKKLERDPAGCGPT